MSICSQKKVSRTHTRFLKDIKKLEVDIFLELKEFLKSLKNVSIPSWNKIFKYRTFSNRKILLFSH